MTILTLRPDAAGTYTQFDNQNPATGAHYDKVDEVSADDLTTYIITTTANDIDSFNLPASGLGIVNITSVKVYAKLINLAAMGVDGVAQIMCRTNSNDYFGSNISLPIAMSWTTFNKEWALNPNTGVAWTVAEIDALEIGVKCITGGGPPIIICTQLYVEIILADSMLDSFLM